MAWPPLPPCLPVGSLSPAINNNCLCHVRFMQHLLCAPPVCCRFLTRRARVWPAPACTHAWRQPLLPWGVHTHKHANPTFSIWLSAIHVLLCSPLFPKPVFPVLRDAAINPCSPWPCLPTYGMLLRQRREAISRNSSVPPRFFTNIHKLGSRSPREQPSIAPRPN